MYRRSPFSLSIFDRTSSSFFWFGGRRGTWALHLLDVVTNKSRGRDAVIGAPCVLRRAITSLDPLIPSIVSWIVTSGGMLVR